MASSSKTTRGVVLTLIGGTCWGFSGTCAKFLMDGYGVDPVWLVCVRQFFASWLFLALACASRTDRERLGGLVRELGRGWKTLALVAVTAACMMVNSVCYIVTVKVTNSATATVLQTLALVVLMVYSCVAARRGPRGRELAGLALALGGTFLIATGGDPTHLAMPAEGLAWGLATCATYALYSAVPEGLLKRWGSPAVNGVTMLASGTVLLVATRPWESVPALDAAGVAGVVAIVVVGTFLAYALYMQGVKDLGPLRASMLGTSEPIAATVFSMLWLGTAFAPTDLAGFAMIIAMVYLTA